MSAPSTSRCRSCGAEIFWAQMESGKRMPVDASPAEHGTVALTMRGDEIHGEVVRAGERELLRTSHFATCPHAQQHRQSPQGRLL